MYNTPVRKRQTFEEFAMRRLFASIVAIGLALTALTWPHSASAQNLQKLRVTIPVPVFTFFPLYFAQENGYFAKEGLDVETISTNGDGPDVDALIAGSVQFTASTPNRLFMSYEQGKSLLDVMTLTNRMSIDCFMNKALADKLGITADSPFDQKLKAMKDQTVAGTRPGAFTYLLLQAYAKRAGLTPQKDITIIGVGGPNSMLPAVENGQVAVACIGSPTVELAVARGKSIEFSRNLAGKDPIYNDFLFQHIYVRPDYAKENPEVVKKFIRGLLTAINYLVDTPIEKYLPELKKHFSGLSDELLIDIFTRTRATFKRDGVTTEESYKKVAAFLIDTGAITKVAPFKELVTNDYLPAR
jgi:NitT/TauT family transport system substrate-binding protein